MNPPETINTKKIIERIFLASILLASIFASTRKASANYYGDSYHNSRPQLQGRVVYIQAGTPISAVLPRTLSSEFTSAGMRFDAAIQGPNIPYGTHGTFMVTNVESAGRAKKSGSMDFKLVAVRTPDGKTYQASATVDQSIFRLQAGGSRIGSTVKRTAYGAAGGALAGLIGSAVSGGKKGKGTAIGTGIGAGVGLLSAGVSKGEELIIPAGSNIPFILDSALQLSLGGPPPGHHPGYQDTYGYAPPPPSGNIPNPYGYQAPPSSHGRMPELQSQPLGGFQDPGYY